MRVIFRQKALCCRALECCVCAGITCIMWISSTVLNATIIPVCLLQVLLKGAFEELLFVYSSYVDHNACSTLTPGRRLRLLPLSKTILEIQVCNSLCCLQNSPSLCGWQRSINTSDVSEGCSSRHTHVWKCICEETWILQLSCYPFLSCLNMECCLAMLALIAQKWDKGWVSEREKLFPAARRHPCRLGPVCLIYRAGTFL